MFVIFDREKQKKPIKVWLNSRSELEESCLEQAYHLANLPFLFKHVALMPDTHTGYGMPIGGVIALKEAIIPNAVGNDIGCGVAFIHTDLDVKELSKSLIQKIVEEILKTIPTGFEHQKAKKSSPVLTSAKDELVANLGKANPSINLLYNEIDRAYYQTGTLGGGNHFIELQKDEDGKLGIMVHSGSRNLGYQICRYFNKVAQELREKWPVKIPSEWQLSYLPVSSVEGQSYIQWMNLALNFAQENRQNMMDKVIEIITNKVRPFRIELKINAHHNYAAVEDHFGKEVWVHRKGAIRARKGEPGIIPGAMGSYSYIVEGLGNPESFCSCSHGAGRRMGRKEAKRQFSTEQVLTDLKDQNIILGIKDQHEVVDECRFAYKNIDIVIKNEKDLVQPIIKLKTVAVVKGSEKRRR